MKWSAIAVSMSVLMLSGADAHHSFAMYDHAKELALSGTVKEVQWANPHVWIEIAVPAADGSIEGWSIEGGSPSSLANKGLRRSSFKPGDRIVAKIHPLKSGEKGGSLIEISLGDGAAVGTSPATPKPGQ